MVTLRQGSTGPDVKTWQTYLGHPIVVDGIFGPKTEAATIAFKKAHGLPANGIVDAPAWKAAMGAGQGWDQRTQRPEGGVGWFTMLASASFASALGIGAFVGARWLVKAVK